jgi:hypothetical protein
LQLNFQTSFFGSAVTLPRRLTIFLGTSVKKVCRL